MTFARVLVLAASALAVTEAFDRADRNRDGKLSVAEYQCYTRLQAKAKAKKKQALARKTGRSAAAGGTATSHQLISPPESAVSSCSPKTVVTSVPGSMPAAVPAMSCRSLRRTAPASK